MNSITISISYFISTAGKSVYILKLLLHHSSAGTDRKRRLFGISAAWKCTFSEALGLLLLGTLPSCVSPPPESAEQIVVLAHIVWPRCFDCVGFCCFTLGGMMQSASEASLLTTHRRGCYAVQWHRSARPRLPQSAAVCVFPFVSACALCVLLCEIYSSQRPCLHPLFLPSHFHAPPEEVGLTQRFPGSFIAGAIDKAASVWRRLLGPVFGCSHVGVAYGFIDEVMDPGLTPSVNPSEWVIECVCVCVCAVITSVIKMREI